MAQNPSAAETQEIAGQFEPGQRVQLLANPIGVTLGGRTGSVLRPDKWDGYYIVRLDTPALYHASNGEAELLHEIRVAADNLALLPTQR
jgi:hypothetical protein